MSESPSIVITGASAGIGAEAGLFFAEKGWTVIMGARRLERLSSLKNKAKSQKIHALSLDVTSQDSVEQFTKKALEIAGGSIDVLFNNAGLALGVDSVATGNLNDWQSMIDTNLTGLLRVTRSFLPKMMENSRGQIVNMGSIAGHVVYEGGSIYCATKHAVRAITKTLRLELNGTPIRVTSIDPGMVETEFSMVRFNQDQKKAEGVYRGLKPLTPNDIVECLWFAVSRPAHVNIEEIVLMPIAQAAPHKVSRQS